VKPALFIAEIVVAALFPRLARPLSRRGRLATSIGIFLFAEWCRYAATEKAGS
jgi:hypothetical protein